MDIVKCKNNLIIDNYSKVIWFIILSHSWKFLAWDSDLHVLPTFIIYTSIADSAKITSLV